MVYKIRSKATGLFAAGTSVWYNGVLMTEKIKWNKVGKTWSRLDFVRSHLRSKKRFYEEEFEIVEYDIVEKQTMPA